MADGTLPAGDLDPEIRTLQSIDPMGLAEELTMAAKPEIIEGVIADNPDGDMDELQEEVQEVLKATELGIGLWAVQSAAALQKEAYLRTDDSYHCFPYEEMQRVLSEEGFSCVYHETFSDPELMLVRDEEHPRPDSHFEIWFNSEGTLLRFDTTPRMEYTLTPPMLLGHEVNAATLEYNWRPAPGTFVYKEEGMSAEEERYVEEHHYGNFTSSGHFLGVDDADWEDLSKRVWVGNHYLVSGGFRYALHNLRANGDFLPEWREAPSPPAFSHWGDRKETADYRYEDYPEALVAAKSQLEMRVRERYQALPEEVKRCIGPFHTWETRRGERPLLDDQLPSLDYTTEEPDSGPALDGPAA